MADDAADKDAKNADESAVTSDAEKAESSSPSSAAVESTAEGRRRPPRQRSPTSMRRIRRRPRIPVPLRIPMMRTSAWNRMKSRTRSASAAAIGL